MPFASRHLGSLVQPGTILPITTILAYAGQIAIALATIHENGFVHRDLKPQNILVSPYKSPLDPDEVTLWLADFGISVVSQTKMPYPQKQDVSGTYRFMAPEQWKGDAVRASDQYALGIILYSWFTGVYPFQPATSDGLVWATVHTTHQVPPFAERTTQWDRRFEAVIQRMLEKEPARRFPNIIDAYTALRTVYETIKQEETAIFNRSLQKKDDELRVYQRQFADHPLRGILVCTYRHRAMVYSVSWSPDGRYIASGGYDTTVQVWEVATGKSVSTCTGHNKGVHSVSWSPDGNYIASGGYDKTVHVREVAEDIGSSHYTGHKEGVRSVSWSPDGRYIASGSEDHTVQIWKVLPDWLTF